jgi:hypothetical protein
VGVQRAPISFWCCQTDGTVQHWEGREKYTVRSKNGYDAIGSGGRVAVGAMWKGASAEEAVHAAIAHDSACGGEVLP